MHMVKPSAYQYGLALTYIIYNITLRRLKTKKLHIIVQEECITRSNKSWF